MDKTRDFDKMPAAMSDPKNRGYHVIVVGAKVFRAKTGEGAAKILQDIRHKYPKKTPAITYIPDADSLILWI